MTHYVFTMTAGRTGTAWLAKLFAANIDCIAKHEYLNFGEFGIYSQDVGLMGAFNQWGNKERVQTFWKRKFDLIPKCSMYVETNHALALGGKAAVCEVQQLGFDAGDNLSGSANKFPFETGPGRVPVSPPESCQGEMQLYALLRLTLVENIRESDMLPAAKAMKEFLKFKRTGLGNIGILEVFAMTYKVDVSIQRHGTSGQAKPMSGTPGRLRRACALSTSSGRIGW